MKRIIIILFCVMLTLFCSQVCGAESRYGRLSLGLAMPENSDITDVTDPETRAITKFKKNMLISGAVGWEYDYFRFEGEYSYQSNDIESASVEGINIALSGDISALTLLMNGYFDYKNTTNFTPYLSAGLGVSMLSLSGLGVPDGSFGPISDEDIVFAHQLGCGIIYRMDKKISLDLNYRYFAPSDSKFHSIRTDFASHNISLGLRIYF